VWVRTEYENLVIALFRVVELRLVYEMFAFGWLRFLEDYYSFVSLGIENEADCGACTVTTVLVIASDPYSWGLMCSVKLVIR